MVASNQYFADLSVFQNDPELANILQGYALQGEANAQYAMGLLYALGFGKQYNPVESYAWLTAAAIQGHAEATQIRTLLGGILSENEVEVAQERAGIIIMQDEGFEDQH